MVGISFCFKDASMKPLCQNTEPQSNASGKCPMKTLTPYILEGARLFLTF